VSRTYERKEVPPDTRPRFEVVERRKCDRCGRAIDPEELEEEYAHELVVILDQDKCVNFYRRRDYCLECLEPIWEAVNALLGVTKESIWGERDKEYEC
jgi:hypothetical protein